MTLQRCNDDSGETGRVLTGDVKRFIEDGTIAGGDNEEFFKRAAHLIGADNQHPSVGRMLALMDAGAELFGRASGPLLNLTNVAARTGMVVMLTTVVRQYVSFYAEQAIRGGDSPDATRAWAEALTAIPLAMSLMGAIRDECAGTASVLSRLGRVLMAGITLGSLFLAHMTGATNNLLASMISTNVYTLARDLTNAFFPLQDNAGRATALSTGVSTAAYGTVQFALAELNALMPLSGAGRFAAGLDYSLGADAVQGAFNALGAIADDAIFILCRSWSLLSPSAGLDSALPDPESLQRSVLEVRAGARLPTRAQQASALLNVNASRTSAFQAINLAIGAAALWLASSDQGEDAQGHILNVCLMTMLMLIYFPFIWSCSQRTDRSYTPAPMSENPAP